MEGGGTLSEEQGFIAQGGKTFQRERKRSFYHFVYQFKPNFVQLFCSNLVNGAGMLDIPELYLTFLKI